MRFCLIFVWLFMSLASPVLAGVRIKDITAPRGLRDNQLVGYGLVVGLQGTGDSLRNATFTDQSIQSMLDRMGVNIRGGQLRTKNIAAVLVTANLPPFAKQGSRIDLTVSSLGDATSLMGGMLIMTPMNGADGQTYAVAQGQVAISGFAAKGQAETISEGVPTAGRIANGATIERELPMAMNGADDLDLELKNPDFSTSVHIADAINHFSRAHYGMAAARERDYHTVEIRRPGNISPTRFLAEIGDLTVEADSPARVVIDARSGTIVIGQDVQISTVAVTHGNISVQVSESPQVSQPDPYSHGQTVVTPDTDIAVKQAGGHIAIVEGTTLHKLVRGLNQIGLKPSGIISILQAIKTAGALQAELVVQ